MEKLLNYSDVCLVPKMGVLENRSQAITLTRFGKFFFAMPVVAANMASVINEEIAEWLASNGYFYIMHRFPKGQSLSHFSINFCRRMEEKGLYTSISLGVKEDSVRAALDLAKKGINPDFITLDIAHAHSEVGKLALVRLRNLFPDSFIIAGNVATPEGVEFLEYWGADATKVGIGGSPVCTTRNKTGFGIPMFSCVLECTKINKKYLIADSGIREHGDITKALVAGADMVMVGSLLSAHLESPGDTVEANGQVCKAYYGSASARNKGEHKNVEGIEKLIPIRGSIVDTYKEMKEDLQSSISYAGGESLYDLLDVEWQPIN